MPVYLKYFAHANCRGKYCELSGIGGMTNAAAFIFNSARAGASERLRYGRQREKEEKEEAEESQEAVPRLQEKKEVLPA
jgi:hypothetical protein